MLFLPIPSNHGVWSRFNFQLRLAHIPIASEIRQIRLRLNAEGGVEVTVKIGGILREIRISRVLTELCARRSRSAVMSDLSAQAVRRS